MPNPVLTAIQVLRQALEHEKLQIDYKQVLVGGRWLVFNVGLRLDIHLKVTLSCCYKDWKSDAVESPWAWEERGSAVAVQIHNLIRTHRHTPNHAAAR